MNEYNKKKYDLLKEPFGTASAKLRKAILFQLLQETGKDICFQCEEKIETIEDLSIEHKEPWMSAKDPIKSFYDLNNISFSHLNCNVSYARRGEKNPLSKLTEKEVSEIKDLIEQGFSSRNIAKKYNITHTTIYHITNFKTWNKK